jgi:hypothetical protein
MKKKLLVIIILVAVFLLFIFVRFFFLDKRSNFGKIKIVSSPAASVFINDVNVGKTPYEDASLEVGDYSLKLIPEGKDKSTVPWDDKVQIHKNTLTYISRELGTSELTSAGEVLTVVPMENKPKGNAGEIYIDTEPTGAIIYLDNDEKGIASIVLQDVPPGDHELAVYLPGFFRRAQKIQVEKGYQVRAKFKLALDQSHKTLEEELLEKRKEASAEAKKREEEKEASNEAETKTSTTTGTTVEVLDTPTGFLNVRSEPSVDGDIVTTVAPGDTYEYSDTQDGWYKITTDDGSVGWVSGDYVEEK